ncbi:MAG: tetratricopeptide repeat protein [Treponema sp.]|nr:tetratricopeptide repeat protein [Treponema sp.]
MPGLNQLKQFSEDIRAVGDEVKIRAQRGEKLPIIPLPGGISEEDDSNDFLIGLPDGTTVDAPSRNDNVDMDAEIQSIMGGDSGLDSLVDSTIVADDDDLAEFLNDDPLAQPPEELEADDSLEEVPAREETPLEDMDLDSLLNPDQLLSEDGDSAADEEKLQDSTEKETSPDSESPDFNLDDLGNLTDFADMSSKEAAAPSESESFNLDDLGEIQDFPQDQTAVPGASSGDGNFNLDDLGDISELSDPSSPAEEINLNEDLPESILENDGLPPAGDKVENLAEAPASEEMLAPEADSLGGMDDFESSEGNDGSPLDLGGFDIDSLINGDESDSPEDESLTDAALSALENKEDASASDSSLDSMTLPGDDPFSQEMPPLSDDFTSEPAGEGPASSMDSISAQNAEEDLPLADGEVPDAAMDVPSDGLEEINLETFDTSGMDGVDFGPEKPEGEEFPATDDGLGNDDDFILDSSFEIPGFSDTETADLGKKKSGLDLVDFSKGKEGVPKNSLTDDEYIQFKKNLANYPLNLRIAIEDFIVRDEFTDDAVFEVIEKVLKKTSARQLATQLEKILDVSINIPRDFERRSFAEYEAYKQSFQYQLKNRIIPAAIVGVILCFVCFGLFKAGQRFIYKPVMANIHYKQGYTLLQENEFPQSEEEFKEAVSYKPVKKWFFKYAEGYRQKKQFDRAGKMYKNILLFFNQDKIAGLNYAEMELYDRANYQRAEEIVRREVLDYHINDADGILLLGDVFLEWAGIDESKYELAKQQYLDLMQRYGSNSLYLSRMLRYNIRTDKLREVLYYKNIFYQSKQDKENLKNLGASDWRELSGYLLDKLYGKLSKNDEYLRSSIEDVLAMLNLAIKAEPVNPIGHYNLAQYAIHNGNTEQAKAELEKSLELFEGQSVRTKKNVYREINATRILGQLYADNREYLKAQTIYTRGINLYNEEHEASELEGDENTGKLFANMGDLDYFISGEMDDALYNYEQAIKIKNDTPSINYRVGAIYYNRQDYDNALVSFIKVSEKEPKDPNVLLSLGNVLSIRGDNFAAESYYSDLLKELDKGREKQKFLLPQADEDDYATVDLYLKANNNLGVTLYRLAHQTGDSNMNAQAMVRLSDSIRAWDALTRNQKTMIRMEGSNLAAQNSKYITHPHPDFEPAIYTDIPRLMAGEKSLE